MHATLKETIDVNDMSVEHPFTNLIQRTGFHGELPLNIFIFFHNNRFVNWENSLHIMRFVALGRCGKLNCEGTLGELTFEISDECIDEVSSSSLYQKVRFDRQIIGLNRVQVDLLDWEAVGYHIMGIDNVNKRFGTDNR